VQTSLLSGARRRRSLGGQWAVIVLFLAILGELISWHPGLTGAIVLMLAVFAIGLFAPLELSFPMLGFLVVFDSVFSLGTEVKSTTLVLIGISISNPLVVGMAARLLTEAGMRKRKLNRQGLWISGAIVISAFVSSFLSPDKLTRSTVTLVGAGVIVLVLTSYGSAALVRRFLVGVAAASACGAATGLFTLFSAERGLPALGRVYRVIGTNPIAVPRVSGFYQNPAALAFTLVAGTFAVLAVVSNRLLRWGLLAALTFVLIVTYSRGGLSGLLLGFFVYGAVRFARRRRIAATGRPGGGWRMFSVGLLVGGILLLLALNWAAQSPRIAPYWNPGSVTVRAQLAKAAVQVWKSNFLIGIGPGEFLRRGGFGLEVHNTFLQMGAEMGILGFAGLAALTWFGLRRAALATLNATSPADVWFYGGMTAGVVAVVTVGLTLTLLGVKLMWAMLAIAAIAPSGEGPDAIPRIQGPEDVRRWTPALRV
jgi:hypothetical protein